MKTKSTLYFLLLYSGIFLWLIISSPKTVLAVDWTQLGGNPQRTGYSPQDIPTPWRMKWIWNGPGGVNGMADGGPAADHLRLPKGVQPVTGEGKLYVGHDDGTVRAISEATGQQVWSRLLGGKIVNTAAYDADSVYVGSTNGSIFRLLASDGTVLASNDIGGVNGEIQMAPLVVGDTVYVGVTNGNFYALNKTDLSQRWVYNAGATLLGSTAYSGQFGGLIILLAEDKSVHAVQTSTGTRRWRVTVNADVDPYFSNQIFADSYPVVSETNGLVLVRSHLLYSKMDFDYNNTPFSTVAEIRQFLQSNPTYKSMFALSLDTGQEKFTVPVLYGGLGNGGMESVPPQAVVKKLADGSEVAYVLWRSGEVRALSANDRQDMTLGEMNLGTGNIRYVQDYRNQGTMRMPADEQSPLSMVGDTLLYAHWLNLGSVRITDRSSGLGGSYSNPIKTTELTPAINTLASGSCSNRDSGSHTCLQDMYAPGEADRIDPGFYVYYYNQKVYDLYWQSPVRNAVLANGTIYWRSNDGAITAITSINTLPSPTPTSLPSLSPTPTPLSSTPSPTPAIIIGNGDANGDGQVNISDITTILQNWLKNLTAPIDQYGDGLINSFDFAVVANKIPVPTPTSTPPTPPPTTSTIVAIRVNTTAQDGESIGTTEYTLPSSAPWGSMYLGYDNGTPGNVYDGGWNFNTTIPQGTIITGATVTLTGKSDNSGSVSGTWYGFNVDNVLDFENNVTLHRISDHAVRTTQSVSDTFTVVSNGATYISPDLSSIVQNIVSRPNFSGKIGLTFRSNTTTDNWQSFVDYSDNPARSALLTINLYSGTIPSPTPTPTPTSTPGPTPTPPPPVSGEWTQHGHDAQRTSYTDQVVATPWRWKWSWNGPNATGGVSKVLIYDNLLPFNGVPTAIRTLPRNLQPVTGGGRVYIAAGRDGVYALNNVNGLQVWRMNPAGETNYINSTVAYDPDTGALFAVASNGVLYKMDSATGATLGQFPSGASSILLPLPPAVISDQVFFSMGNNVYAVNKTTMEQIWSYDAGSAVHTPPAYSPSRNRVVVATQDLFVHAINNTDGARSWRVKPTVRTPGEPGSLSNNAEVSYGWPVIAEVHGLVLVKYHLDWNAMYSPFPAWPADNAAMRTGLTSSPAYQALMVLDLDDGTVPFIANIGHGGFGDGGYMPMGPQPVVKKFSDGNEVVYTVIRGDSTKTDGRGDSHFGEMVLDSTTVPGLLPGYVRWIQYGNYGWPTWSNNDPPPTDEQPNPTMAGNQLFFATWPVGHALQITDRSPNKGSFTNPIVSTPLPVVVEVTTSTSGASWNPSHYSPNNFAMVTTEGEWRAVRSGFYIYWNQGKVYDQYWSEYASWVVSNNTVYFVSTDGAIVTLENGNP